MWLDLCWLVSLAIMGLREKENPHLCQWLGEILGTSEYCLAWFGIGHKEVKSMVSVTLYLKTF